MNASQGVILIMLGVLVLYLVWRDRILGTVAPPTSGVTGGSGLVAPSAGRPF